MNSSSRTSCQAPLVAALLQINPTVGDLQANVATIAAATRQAYAQGARLVLTPEMALCGYPPEDLLLRPAFVHACEQALGLLAQSLADLQDLSLVVGHPQAHGQGQAAQRSASCSQPQLLNAASVLQGGRRQGVYAKRELPNYQVFDERRYFLSGREAGLAPLVVEVQGWRVGVLLCEDAWFDEPAQAAKSQGAQVLAVLNASPYHAGKSQERVQRMADRARSVQMPLLYAHLWGGQDEVVFDGASFAVDAQGRLAARAAAFEDALLHVSLSPDEGSPAGIAVAGSIAEELSGEAQRWQALVTGVRDYFGKNGFAGAIIGLSGGVDSALVLCLAVDALGADRVRTVMMPSRYTAEMSWVDAREMAARLGVRHDEIPIAGPVQAFEQALAAQFAGLAADTTEENIQARVRGTLLMALSNKTGDLVLTTGNKSEMATGYCTLYGDMAGGFAVIKDVFKTWVYRLGHWRNAQAKAAGLPEPIPLRILTRAPSAELRADQTDQDSLPEYEVLDDILMRHLECDESASEIVEAGHERVVVEKVLRLVKLNEYKRRQSPIGIRITHRAFGRDWRLPITSRFKA